MADLHAELSALTVEWPETPDLAGPVLARIEAAPAQAPARPRRMLWPRALAYAAAALAAAFALTMAVSPDARSAVLEWLGLKSVQVEREEPRPTSSGLRLGEPVTLEEARRRAPFLRLPAALGEPRAVHAGRASVALVYDGPLLVQEFPARVEPFIEKTIGMGARLERLRVEGAPAFFIEGAHGFAYEGPGGGRFEEQRIAGNTLLVERPDGLLIRIEGTDLARERAVAIAASIP
jgi:hypothetical protein